MFDNIVGDAIGAGIRHGATLAGGMLVANGLMNSSQLSSFEGSIIFLGALGWSIFEKWRSRSSSK